jgi:trans-aconitate 2-methyltransferase
MNLSDKWQPAQYDRFKAERRQPFLDLLAMVQRPAEREDPVRVADLGCGTGGPTVELHTRVQDLALERSWELAPEDHVQTTGIDSSPEMFKAALKLYEGLSPGPSYMFGLGFALQSIEDFANDCATGAQEPLDVIFSNAALHWVDDHPALLAQLTAGLKRPGGQLAVQVPANFDHPSQLAADEVAGEQPFVDALGGYRRGVKVLTPERYSELLHQLGYREQHVRLQVYGHLLDRPADVVEWTRGSLLTDYERRLTPELFAAFVERYRELLLPRLDRTEPYFYTFKRILLWGRL